MNTTWSLTPGAPHSFDKQKDPSLYYGGSPKRGQIDGASKQSRCVRGWAKKKPPEGGFF
jgi:hypothetical protein